MTSTPPETLGATASLPGDRTQRRASDKTSATCTVPRLEDGSGHLQVYVCAYRFQRRLQRRVFVDHRGRGFFFFFFFFFIFGKTLPCTLRMPYVCWKSWCVFQVAKLGTMMVEFSLHTLDLNVGLDGFRHSQKGLEFSHFFWLLCCLTSTEAGWPIRDGDRVGKGPGWLARPRKPPEKDRRDRGPPPEQWKC